MVPMNTSPGTPFDGLGAERIVEAWLLAHGDTEVDDEGGTLRDFLEWSPDVRSDLESRIARALGSAKAERARP